MGGQASVAPDPSAAFAFYFDPVNGLYRSGSTRSSGPVRHNLVTYSQAFDNAAWVKDGATVTANSIAAPDGTVTADTITSTGASGGEVYQTIGLPLAPSVYSIRLKRGNNDWHKVRYLGNAAWFNLNTGTVGTQTGCTATITALSDGWYQCTIAFTPTTANSYVAVAVVTGDGISTTAANGQFFYAWGAQPELGTAATAYIPTTANPA
jgi:hypothetical protein